MAGNPYDVGDVASTLHQMVNQRAQAAGILADRVGHLRQENAELKAQRDELLALLEEAVAVLEGFSTHEFLRGSAEYVLRIARPAITKIKEAQ